GGGPRDGRREDAGDGRRVPGLEADAAHAGAGVVRRIDHRRAADCERSRHYEVRAAVRNLPRARRCGSSVGRPGAARLVPGTVLMQLTPNGYAFLGVTALVAALVSVVVFAMLRFSIAAREARRHVRGTATAETAMLS